jgi:hypothetical protein
MGIIEGETKSDAQKEKQDLNASFADKKFDQFRNLISLDKGGKRFNSISSDALSAALSGVNLTDDEKSAVDQVTNAINSKEIHKVEFADQKGTLSEDGSAALYPQLPSGYKNDKIISDPSAVPSWVVQATGGEGVTVKTKGGSYSVILEGGAITYPDGGNRATTSAHEVLGHGIPTASGASSEANNGNAIRTENLFRRLMGISTQRDGSDHGGGVVSNPTALPTLKDN